MANIGSIFIWLLNLWVSFRNFVVRRLRKPPDYVWIEVSGGLPEFAARPGFVRRRLQPSPPDLSLSGARRRLALLSGDGRVRGVILRIRNLEAGWASLEELRSELLRYRENGGRVVAHMVEAGVGAYYLASAADEVLATPVSTVDVTGVRTSVTFVKDALDRVGIETNVVAVSPYKSAYDRFARNDFSPESREQVERLLDGRFDEFVAAVADGRGMSEDEVRRAVDDAPYPAKVAVERGLLDAVAYEDELPARLGSGEDARISEWAATEKALARPKVKGGKRVGVVAMSGAIMRGKSRRLPVPLPLLGSEQVGDETVVAALRAAEANQKVSAILFNVESGGGDALASDLIWREVERIRNKKPVVVLMGNVAASGGYYVGAAADHITVRRSTVTGSIGVISLRPVATRLYRSLGLTSESIERGARAGLLDVTRQPSDDELEAIRGQILSIYEEFKDRVVRGRGIASDRLEELAGGRVWTGAEAVRFGLADGSGGFREALDRARELGGVVADGPDAVLEVQPPKKGRLAPGTLVPQGAEAVEDYRRALLDLLAVNVWAISPFSLKDDDRGRW